MTTQHLKIPLKTGITVHATLVTPTAPAQTGTVRLAVCLHPYGPLGGRMDDPVLQLLESPLLEHGFHILRYNSRGFGGSSGWPSLTGFTEGKDLEAVVEWALDAEEVAKSRSIEELLVVGYSHGSLISTLLPLPSQTDTERTKRTSHILISYPLGPRGLLTLFKSSLYQSKLEELVKRGRVLLIYGDSDDFTGVKDYDDFVDGLRDVAKEASSGTEEEKGLEIVKVNGATHFWRGACGERLRECVGDWLGRF